MSSLLVNDELQNRLFDETPFWCRNCAWIVDKKAKLVPLVPNEPQLRLDRALEAQRAAGKPMRAIILKARKLGFSTFAEAKIMHRITLRQHRRALVVAQDKMTAGELFGMSERMHSNLPVEEGLEFLKPTISNRRRAMSMTFAEPSKNLREQGAVGLDSSLTVDTANEIQAGRGFSYTELHCSEVAFWPDVAKLTSLLNAVPDEEETMVLLESTANGSNHFRDRWDRAVAGESDYVPVFAAWHEDPANARKFYSKEERSEFIASIGEGPWGEDEPRLVDEFGCAPEQLAWRRQAIVDKADSDLAVFKQEHPASPEEAFMAQGRHVFSMALVSKVLDRAATADLEAEVGELEAGRHVARKVRSGVIEVPTDPRFLERQTTWASRKPFWKVWHHPEPGEHYVVACDPAEGEEATTSGETAFTAIQVINHVSKAQVAEYRSRVEADLIAEQLFLAAHYWNQAYLAIEVTGGYGTFMARRCWREYGYPLMYKRKSVDSSKDRQEDRLGWDSNRATKVFLEDGMRELLREGSDGISSLGLASELTTYIRDEKGKTGPEHNKFSDLLMAYMIAQYVAQERVVPADRKARRPMSFRPRDKVTGY